ncbi:MAG: hypothetical protein J7J43_05315 [Thermosipho sp. (in: Bacteria)]|nr:hypothetical protein [Thermosipho sp. (in: thermotogales)]
MAKEKIKVMNSFEKNVFVNCPFDSDYNSLLKTLLFTILYCGYNPRIALERLDSGEVRLMKIKELIDESKFSIHDLSRIKSSDKNEYYRLNMPFEIGLDLGCRLYNSDKKYRDKKSLILEAEQYSYQKGLSDLSNSDVRCHKNEPEELVYDIRNWFGDISGNEMPGGSMIWDNYNYFLTDLYEKMINKGLKQKDIDRMTIAELINKMKDWIETKTTKPNT